MKKATEERLLNRDRFINNLENTKLWDIIIIGGGATGLGAAVDVASRGYKTLLLEQSDFAKATSSRSTKLIHGGIRYLAQGNIKLVYEALHERGILLRNAPHLVKKQCFIIPFFDWWMGYMYWIGMKLYQWLAGSLSMGKSQFLSREETLKNLPEIKSDRLKGGIMYYDAQFDDARLAIHLAQTCAEQGGSLLNYFKVSALLKEGNKISGVIAHDLENQKEYHLHSKVVINATGVFADAILQLDEPRRPLSVKPSQGTHIVLNKSFFKSTSAMVVPKTSDGRVLFAIPWQGHVLVGTTDTPLDENSLEPKPLDEEIDFILKTFENYFDRTPQKTDILSVFCGLRPLVIPSKNASTTKDISRNHKLMLSKSGLITIIGGKWTTYRKMAEDTIDKAIQVGRLKQISSETQYLKIHGFGTPRFTEDHSTVYGTDASHIKKMIDKTPILGQKLADHWPHTAAEVVWATRNEMARTVEDVLARRLRILFLDARSAMNMVSKVASLMAKELHKDQAWEKTQITSFKKLAERYLVKTS